MIEVSIVYMFLSDCILKYFGIYQAVIFSLVLEGSICIETSFKNLNDLNRLVASDLIFDLSYLTYYI